MSKVTYEEGIRLRTAVLELLQTSGAHTIRELVQKIPELRNGGIAQYHVETKLFKTGHLNRRKRWCDSRWEYEYYTEGCREDLTPTQQLQGLRVDVYRHIESKGPLTIQEIGHLIGNWEKATRYAELLYKLGVVNRRKRHVLGERRGPRSYEYYVSEGGVDIDNAHVRAQMRQDSDKVKDEMFNRLTTQALMETTIAPAPPNTQITVECRFTVQIAEHKVVLTIAQAQVLRDSLSNALDGLD